MKLTISLNADFPASTATVTGRTRTADGITWPMQPVQFVLGPWAAEHSLIPQLTEIITSLVTLGTEEKWIAVYLEVEQSGVVETWSEDEEPELLSSRPRLNISATLEYIGEDAALQDQRVTKAWDSEQLPTRDAWIDCWEKVTELWP